MRREKRCNCDQGSSKFRTCQRSCDYAFRSRKSGEATLPVSRCYLPNLSSTSQPTEATYQLYEEAGTDLGQYLTQKKAVAEKKANLPMDVAKAIGRISGGLYVVTAFKGASRGAMIVSWASFKPLTIADRAIESLMQVGDSFVLNCLEEGNFAPLMKHFSKRFLPGADRFDGIDWTPAANGSPVLNDGIA